MVGIKNKILNTPINLRISFQLYYFLGPIAKERYFNKILSSHSMINLYIHMEKNLINRLKDLKISSGYL